MFRKFRIGTLAYLAVVVAACQPHADRTYTLYRTSSVLEGSRIHVATFNADETATYNLENCEQAQVLFQNQPGILTRFWCEKGYFRK